MSKNKYVSLYEYLGHAAGGELGQKVAYAATKQEIKPDKRYIEQGGYKGDVYLYPTEFLDTYFSIPMIGSDGGYGNPQPSEK
tara:strand:+ start:1717 stop:1962 length:246 start_codon:yes stop_codon:yes gene_type:complete